MELHGCDAEAGRKLMEACEDAGYSTKRFYRLLQEQLGGRMLVDKSPQYALDPAALARAERDFEEPLYIHLVRLLHHAPEEVNRGFPAFELQIH